MKRVFSVILCAVMILSLVLASGCSNSGNNKTEDTKSGENGKNATADENNDTANENNDPFYKYPNTVTLTSAMKINAQAKKLPSTDTLEDNEHTRYLEKVSNIKVKYAFEAENGDAYRQKVKLNIASNSIPDFMVIDEYSALKQMVEYDMIMDIKPYFEKYAYPTVKKIYSSSSGASALKMCTFSGKLAALPAVAGDITTTTMLWLRQDWLDTLGLQPPKTIDDIMAVGKAFVEKDPDKNGQTDTIAIVSKAEFLGGATFSAFYSLDPIFAAYNSYPMMWRMDSKGKVYYGSTASETKTALAKLQEMYKAGIIDKEFAIRKDTMAPISAGKVGMVFGPWHATMSALPFALQNDPKVEWKPVLAPLNAEEKYVSRSVIPSGTFLVISKDCKNPDAVLRYFNFVVQVTQQEYDLSLKPYKDNPELQAIYALTPMQFALDYGDGPLLMYETCQSIVDGKLSLDTQKDSVKSRMKYIQTELANPKKDLASWANATAYMVGCKLLYNNPILTMADGCFFGTTPTKDSKGAILDKLENEAFLKIIMGNEPVSYFDTFVSEWNKLGGDIVTAEVQREVDKNK